MELRQLAYLVAVAEEGGFTRAAWREHVAQPGVSAQIRKLEAELGQPLFDRGAGPVRLTAAGQVVLPFAQAALAAVAGARAAVDELAGLVRGELGIGVIPWVGRWFVATLATFHREHPSVDVRLVEAPSLELLGRVRTGHLDLALAGVAGPPPAGLATEIVTEQDLVAAVRGDHPLARRRTVRVADLAEFPLIALPHETGGRAALEAGFARAGHHPRVAFEAGDPRVLMEFARQGLGVAIVPASAPDDLHAVRIVPRMRSRLVLAWREDTTPSPAARTFVAAARQVLAPRTAPRAD